MCGRELKYLWDEYYEFRMNLEGLGQRLHLWEGPGGQVVANHPKYQFHTAYTIHRKYVMIEHKCVYCFAYMAVAIRNHTSNHSIQVLFQDLSGW